MKIQKLANPSLLLITPVRHEDVRGYFSATWNCQEFLKLDLGVEFIQDNESFNLREGTVRGLHFQLPPYAQAKLVRVVRGRIFDVVVDLRRNSPFRGQWMSTQLTAIGGEQLFIPAGFAHGFCTLEDETIVNYKVTSQYNLASEAGIAWNDPALGINWPVDPDKAIISDKDKRHPKFSEVPDYFSS